jgi:microcystin-dependent protein
MRRFTFRDTATVGVVGSKTDEIPIGGIIMWSNSTIPDGWVECNGANGTPDLRTRFPVASGSSFSTGNTGGAASVTLTTSQIPSHNHGMTSFSLGQGGVEHTHNLADRLYSSNFGGNNGGERVSMVTLGSSGFINTLGNIGHSHSLTGSTSTTGLSFSHENRPAYRSLFYIMRLS